MAFRNRRSGAAYKRLAKEKAIKTAEVLCKVPKLDTFWFKDCKQITKYEFKMYSLKYEHSSKLTTLYSYCSTVVGTNHQLKYTKVQSIIL